MSELMTGMETKVLVGKVTHVFKPIGCVAIRLCQPIQTGDRLRFVKGEEQAMEYGGYFDSSFTVASIEIDHVRQDRVEAGRECAVKLTGGRGLPPNNSLVFLDKKFVPDTHVYFVG